MIEICCNNAVQILSLYLLSLKDYFSRKCIQYLMIRTIILIISLFLFFVPIQSQTTETVEEIVSWPEHMLVDSLESQNMVIRDEVARVIRARYLMKHLEIGVGNIIEHTVEFWEEKVKECKGWMKYDDFEEAFGLVGCDRTPNYNRTKYYGLDHFAVIKTKQNKARTKIKIESLFFEPKHNCDGPPSGYSGIWNIYDVTGQLVNSATYKDGLREGIALIYNQQGGISWFKKYKRDSIYQLAKFSRDGTLAYKKVFNSKERRNWTEGEELEKAFSDKQRDCKRQLLNDLP